MYSTLAGPYEYDLDQKRLLVPESDIESANREIAQLRAEVELLKSRCYPEAVIMVGDVGHYVNKKVEAYITGLRNDIAKRDALLDKWSISPGAVDV